MNMMAEICDTSVIKYFTTEISSKNKIMNTNCMYNTGHAAMNIYQTHRNEYLRV